MLIPSIDLVQGEAVQLIGGAVPALNAGDPMPIADRFSRVGPMAVIDLDAALGRGSNRAVIESLCARYRCRVGGGIRDLETARRWLDVGAEQIIIGTAARVEFVRQLPKERIIVALDAVDGDVVINGWTTKTGRGVAEQMRLLSPYVAGFLVTFVECEGRMAGTHLDRVEALVAAAGEARLTIAGGITTAEDIRALDALGADAQVGMALYTGRLGLAEAFAAPLRTDRDDGLWPTVVVDEYDRALGLCYSNLDSLEWALERGQGIYWSRRRGLWVKGESSGHTQQLLDIAFDCDRDTLRFRVKQKGPGFCHLKTLSCWGPLGGLPALAATLAERTETAPAGSYTRRLLEEPDLLAAKLCEEAGELAVAQGNDAVTWEAADVLYFALVAMARGGVELSAVERHLDRRARRVTRRRGDAKPDQERT